MGRLNKNKEYYSDVEKTTQVIKKEINSGLKILNSIDQDIVTFFGSHKINENSQYYKHCEDLAFELGKKGFAILSGGGPGIMKAANSGATKARVPSIGLKAELLEDEKVKDKIFTHEDSYHFFLILIAFLHPLLFS